MAKEKKATAKRSPRPTFTLRITRSSTRKREGPPSPPAKKQKQLPKEKNKPEELNLPVETAVVLISSPEKEKEFAPQRNFLGVSKASSFPTLPPGFPTRNQEELHSPAKKQQKQIVKDDNEVKESEFPAPTTDGGNWTLPPARLSTAIAKLGAMHGDDISVLAGKYKPDKAVLTKVLATYERRSKPSKDQAITTIPTSSAVLPASNSVGLPSYSDAKSHEGSLALKETPLVEPAVVISSPQKEKEFAPERNLLSGATSTSSSTALMTSIDVSLNRIKAFLTQEDLDEVARLGPPPLSCQFLFELGKIATVGVALSAKVMAQAGLLDSLKEKMSSLEVELCKAKEELKSKSGLEEKLKAVEDKLSVALEGHTLTELQLKEVRALAELEAKQAQARLLELEAKICQETTAVVKAYQASEEFELLKAESYLQGFEAFRLLVAVKYPNRDFSQFTADADVGSVGSNDRTEDEAHSK